MRQHPLKRSLSLADLSNYARCPKLFYADYTKEYSQENLIVLEQLLDLHRFELRNKTIPSFLRIETALKIAFSKLFDKPMETEFIREKIKFWLPKVKDYYSLVFKSHLEAYSTIDMNLHYDFMVDTHTVFALAPVLTANKDGKLCLVLYEDNIETKEDFLRSIVARGHAFGFSGFYPLSHIWNYNPVTGTVTKLILNKEYMTKNKECLLSLVRAIRANISYYGCRKCILGNCS